MKRPVGHWLLWGVAFASVLLVWRVAMYETSRSESATEAGLERVLRWHQYPYVGDGETLRLHRPNCPWLRSVPPRYRILFRTREAALKQGFRSCPRCQP